MMDISPTCYHASWGDAVRGGIWFICMREEVCLSVSQKGLSQL